METNEQIQGKIAISDSKHDFGKKLLGRFTSLFSNSNFLRYFIRGLPDSNVVEANSEDELFVDILGKTSENDPIRRLFERSLPNSSIEILNTVLGNEDEVQIKPKNINDITYSLRSIKGSYEGENEIDAFDFIEKLNIENNDAIVVDASFLSTIDSTSIVI